MSEKPNFTYSLNDPVQTAYANSLLSPRSFKRDGKEQGEPKYGATFLFPEGHADIQPLKQMAIAAARAKWPGVDLKSVKWPWTTGASLADTAKVKGKDREMLRPFACVLTARSKFEVGLSILDNGQIIDLMNATAKNNAKDKYFYDGVLCGAMINFVPYEQNGGFGITCYVNRVLSMGQGERMKIGGGPTGAEVFAKYSGRQSTIDPGANSDLDI